MNPLKLKEDEAVVEEEPMELLPADLLRRLTKEAIVEEDLDEDGSDPITARMHAHWWQRIVSLLDRKGYIYDFIDEIVALVDPSTLPLGCEVKVLVMELRYEKGYPIWGGPPILDLIDPNIAGYDGWQHLETEDVLRDEFTEDDDEDEDEGCDGEELLSDEEENNFGEILPLAAATDAMAPETPLHTDEPSIPKPTVIKRASELTDEDCERLLREINTRATEYRMPDQNHAALIAACPKGQILS